MSLKPSLEEQESLAETLRRKDSRLQPRERLVELLLGLALVIAIAGLWIASPPHSFELTPAVLCLLTFVVAVRVRFDTPLGFTSAVQLAFVPLLFALPVALVPIAVVIALALARLPDVLAGEDRPSRIFLAAGNAWFAVGPAAVFVIANTAPAHAGPALLVAALAAQFVVDFVTSAARFWLERGVGLRSQLRDAWVYVIDAGLSAIALVVAVDLQDSDIVVLAMLPLLGLLAMFAHERRDRLRNLVELNNAYRGTAALLGDVIEADDGYTGEHCKSVVALALELGDRAGLDGERRRNLEFGALLHDVGKIAIPKEIINKRGKLDPDEWELVKTHTVVGQRMLAQVGGFMDEVGLIVRSHHERWDGGGYPDGLAGETIPVEARIITICDSWNAMRTDRSYRRALSHEVALAELLAGTGTQFDSDLVSVFLEVIESDAGAEADVTSPPLESDTLPVAGAVLAASSSAQAA